jgi:hypothetical protein
MLWRAFDSAFSGTDPIGPLSQLRFDQTTFDGDAFLQNASYANQYLQCDTRVRTEWSFRVRPDH